MFPVPLCFNETTSFAQTSNYPAVLRAQQSVFSPFLLTFTPTPSCKNLSSVEAQVILLYYSPSFFMCQLPIYCQLVTNQSPSLLYFVILELDLYFSFASRQNVRFGQQRAPKEHSGNSSMKTLLIRVPGLLFFFFFFLNFSTGSIPVVLKDQFQLCPQAMVSQSDNCSKSLCYRHPLCSCDSQTLLEEAGIQPGQGGREGSTLSPTIPSLSIVPEPRGDSCVFISYFWTPYSMVGKLFKKARE